MACDANAVSTIDFPKIGSGYTNNYLSSDTVILPGVPDWRFQSSFVWRRRELAVSQAAQIAAHVRASARLRVERNEVSLKAWDRYPA
jgi:hypothetical protein